MRDADSYKLRKSIRTPSGVDSIAFSPNSELIASASKWEPTVLVSSVDDGTTYRQFEHPDNTGVRAVAFSPDGKLLATGLDNGSVWLWSLDQDKAVGNFDVKSNIEVNSVVFSPDGTIIATASNDKVVRLWAVKSES